MKAEEILQAPLIDVIFDGGAGDDTRASARGAMS